MSWNLNKNHTTMQIWELSPDRFSTESIKLNCFWFEKIQILKLSDWDLVEKLQPVATEEFNLSIMKHHIYILTVLLMKIITFRRNCKKERNWRWVNLQRHIFDWDFDGRNPAVPLRETEFHYQEESNHYSVVYYFGPSNFPCKGLNVLFGHQKPSQK